MVWSTWPIFRAIRKTLKMKKISQKPQLDMISRSPGIRVQRCQWLHGIREIRQNFRIQWRHRQLLTQFPGDRLIASRCGFWLFFLNFWVLFERYLDKNWSSTPFTFEYAFGKTVCVDLTSGRIPMSLKLRLDTPGQARKMTAGVRGDLSRPSCIQWRFSFRPLGELSQGCWRISCHL